jgi:hypothetical protein
MRSNIPFSQLLTNTWPRPFKLWVASIARSCGDFLHDYTAAAQKTCEIINSFHVLNASLKNRTWTGFRKSDMKTRTISEDSNRFSHCPDWYQALAFWKFHCISQKYCSRWRWCGIMFEQVVREKWVMEFAQIWGFSRINHCNMLVPRYHHRSRSNYWIASSPINSALFDEEEWLWTFESSLGRTEGQLRIRVLPRHLGLFDQNSLVHPDVHCLSLGKRSPSMSLVCLVNGQILRSLEPYARVTLCFCGHRRIRGRNCFLNRVSGSESPAAVNLSHAYLRSDRY